MSQCRGIIMVFLAILGACSSYRSAMQPSIAQRDFGKILTKCKFVGHTSNPNDQGTPINKAIGQFQQGFGNEAQLTILELQSIYENKGASGFDYITGFSLGLIPSFHIDENRYLIKVRQETPTEIRYVRHEITEDTTIWLFAIPFAFWPRNNDDRLYDKFREIYSGYCLPVNLALQ